MKAWWVDEGIGSEWGMRIHAEARGKAKAIFVYGYPGLDAPEFIHLSAYRLPYYDSISVGTDFIDFCPCAICHPEDVSENAHLTSG